MRVAHQEAPHYGIYAYSSFWQILAKRFLVTCPRRGKSENSRVFIGVNSLRPVSGLRHR
jgi:hypothetical protein